MQRSSSFFQAALHYSKAIFCICLRRCIMCVKISLYKWVVPPLSFRIIHRAHHFGLTPLLAQVYAKEFLPAAEVVLNIIWPSSSPPLLVPFHIRFHVRTLE
jgi:hypothetical protein